MTSPVCNSIRLSLVSRLTAVARTSSTSFFSNHWAGLTSQPDRFSSPRRDVLERGGRPHLAPRPIPLQDGGVGQTASPDVFRRAPPDVAGPRRARARAAPPAVVRGQRA